MKKKSRYYILFENALKNDQRGIKVPDEMYPALRIFKSEPTAEGIDGNRGIILEDLLKDPRISRKYTQEELKTLLDTYHDENLVHITITAQGSQTLYTPGSLMKRIAREILYKRPD